jgi:hypothetical protein
MNTAPGEKTLAYCGKATVTKKKKIYKIAPKWFQIYLRQVVLAINAKKSATVIQEVACTINI